MANTATRKRVKFVDPEKAKDAVKSGLMILGGAVMGGMMGTAMHKWSFVAGLGMTAMGAYNGNPMMTGMGAGMIAAGTTEVKNALTGETTTANGRALKKSPEGKFDMKVEMENMKTRAMGFKDQFVQKFPFNMIFKDKKNTSPADDPITAQTMEGLGDAWDYLDRVEQGLVASAMDFQAGEGRNLLEEHGQSMLDDTHEMQAVDDFSISSLDGVDIEAPYQTRTFDQM